MDLLNPAEVAEHAENIRSAEIIIAQPVNPEYRGTDIFSVPFLERTAKRSAAIVVFPSIFFSGQLLSQVYLGDRFSAWGMPYHNLHLVDAVVKRRTASLKAEMASEDLYGHNFVVSECQRSIEDLREREHEHNATIRVSDIIERAGFDRVVMNTINHPRQFVFARVINEMLALLGLGREVSEDGDWLPIPYTPPLPSVVRHLKVSMSDAEGRYGTYNGIVSRDEFVERSVDLYEKHPRSFLARLLIEHPSAQTFLRTCRQTDGDESPGDVATAMIADLYELFFERSPSTEEASHWVKACRDIGGHGILESILRSREAAVRQTSILGRLQDWWRPAGPAIQ